ncbi:hypothetical protein Leryth_009535 [Lithospermum erythrorhizon]|nr:hypothetical protein Leryth_009535 [Lithospermum erythrorhizon]
MSRLKRLISLQHSMFINSTTIISQENNKLLPFIASNHPSQWTTTRSLDIFQMANKAALEKEKARLADEMNRGYFADIHEMKKHGGKISKANKVVVPAMEAVKFPTFEADYSNGSSLKLPIIPNGSGTSVTEDVPKATLMCLSFRSTSQVHELVDYLYVQV